MGKSIRTPKAKGLDFANHSGIYLLHKGYEVVYVGQAQKITERLQDHTKDSLRNRWDNFSWFCIDDIESDNENSNTKSLANEALLDTLEALLIETLGPERNKKVGNGFEDKEFEQVQATDFIG